MRNPAATTWLFNISHPGHTVRRVIVGAACAMLLWAQQVAITHQLWHLLQDSGQAHGVAVHSGDKQKSGSPQKELCALHAVLGTVVGAMGCDDGATFEPIGGGEVQVTTIGRLAPVEFPASPPARGPPQLL